MQCPAQSMAAKGARDVQPCCALCPVPCALCPVPCATMPCALCPVRCALCPVRCALCAAQMLGKWP